VIHITTIKCPECGISLAALGGVGSDTSNCRGCGVTLTRFLDGRVEVCETGAGTKAKRAKADDKRIGGDE